MIKNFYCALEDITTYEEYRNHNLKYFWAAAATTWYEIRRLQAINVSQILVDGPLFFDLVNLSELNIPIRVVANKCYPDYIEPAENGSKGTYIRPEDVPEYSKYVSVITFFAENLQKEAALLRIFKSDQTWPGNLNLLFSGFNENVDNRTIPDQFARARIQCQQACMRHSSCRLCERIVFVGQAITKELQEKRNKIS